MSSEWEGVGLQVSGFRKSCNCSGFYSTNDQGMPTRLRPEA
jgi:hypothetical protein